MIASSFPANSKIIEYLKIHYCINPVAILKLPLGADLNAAVYKVDTQSQPYFVKLKKGYHHDVSIDILELLHNSGIQQIIHPIRTVLNQPILYIDDLSLIVYPFIDGQNGFDQDLSKEQWLILGNTLRQIHKIGIPTLIQQKLRREIYSSQWRKNVRSIYSQIEDISVGNKLADKMLSFMQKERDIIFRLLERAEQLAQKIQNDSPKFVLCHSDIHAGNVLISSNHSIYVVDWDEPIMAPKERDLMFIGGGVGNVWNKPYQEALFYKTYGETDINKTLLAYYRCERIVEDTAVYAQELLLASANSSKNKEQSYQHFIDMFAANGVIEIALKT